MKKNLKRILIFSFILLFLFVGCELKLTENNKMSKEDVVEAINDSIGATIKVDELDAAMKELMLFPVNITNRKSDLEGLMAYYLYTLSAPDTLTNEQAFTVLDSDVDIFNVVSKDLDIYLNRDYSAVFTNAVEYLENNPAEDTIPDNTIDAWIQPIVENYENKPIELQPVPLKISVDGEKYKLELEEVSATEVSDNLSDMYNDVEIYYKEESTSTTASVGKLQTVIQTYDSETDAIIKQVLNFISELDMKLLESHLYFNNLVDGNVDTIHGTDDEKLAAITAFCNGNEGKELLDLKFGFEYEGSKFITTIKANIKEEPVLTSFDDMDWVDVEWNVYTDASKDELKKCIMEIYGFVSENFGN